MTQLHHHHTDSAPLLRNYALYISWQALMIEENENVISLLQSSKI